MSRQSSQSSDEQQIDLTPMLDVVFIMLIFFIVTATFIKLPGADVERAETENAISRKPSMIVAITENNDIWINREKVNPKFLRTNIALLLADNPNGELIIQADSGSDIKNVATVWDAAKEMTSDGHM